MNKKFLAFTLLATISLVQAADKAVECQGQLDTVAFLRAKYGTPERRAGRRTSVSCRSRASVSLEEAPTVRTRVVRGLCPQPDMPVVDLAQLALANAAQKKKSGIDAKKKKIDSKRYDKKLRYGNSGQQRSHVGYENSSHKTATSKSTTKATRAQDERNRQIARCKDGLN